MLCDAGVAELKCDIDERESTKVLTHGTAQPVGRSCWPVGRHRGWVGTRQKAPRHKAETAG